jgi:hypothetical protein
MNSYERETRNFVIKLVIGIATVIMFMAVTLYHLQKTTCRRAWTNSGYQQKFDFFAGCMISADGGKNWIPAENYREIQ